MASLTLLILARTVFPQPFETPPRLIILRVALAATAVRDVAAAGRGVERIVRAGIVVVAAFLHEGIEDAARARAVISAIVGVHPVPVVTLLAGLDDAVAAPRAALGGGRGGRRAQRGRSLTGRPEDVD